MSQLRYDTCQKHHTRSLARLVMYNHSISSRKWKHAPRTTSPSYPLVDTRVAEVSIADSALGESVFVLVTTIDDALSSNGVNPNDAHYIMYCLPLNSLEANSISYINGRISVYDGPFCTYPSVQMREVRCHLCGVLM